MPRIVLKKKKGGSRSFSVPRKVADALVKYGTFKVADEVSGAKPAAKAKDTVHEAPEEEKAPEKKTETREELTTHTNRELREILSAVGVEPERGDTKADLVDKVMRYRRRDMRAEE